MTMVPLLAISMWRMVSFKAILCVSFYVYVFYAQCVCMHFLFTSIVCTFVVFAVLGQIRTTVCQAQLLMRKKLKQYIGLVEEAQDPTIEKRANADDLQVSLNTTIS